MHEMAVTESVLELAERHAREAGAARVTDVHLVIGQLSSFVDDSIQFYWDMASEGTVCQGARLHFRRVPARLGCQDCGREHEMGAELAACPGCGGTRLQVTAGLEFGVDSIVVETDHQGAEAEG